MKLLVTGGAGFIGSHLVDQLVADGDDVCVLDNFSTGKMSNLSGIHRSKNLRIVRTDIRRIPSSLIRRIGRVDGVFHLAAVTAIQESIKHPVLTNDVNVVGTLKVLEAARKLRAQRVVFVSSAAVYGILKKLPAAEDMPMDPISPYGASKAASELYCRVFEENHGIKTVSLRYFNVYGPRQRQGEYSGVISIFAKSILQRRPLTVFGDGHQSRDFVFVKDVADATIRAMQKPSKSKAFNIATGTEATILDVAADMQKLVGRESQFRFLPARQGDPFRGFADITAARSELGFDPRTSLQDGLSATIEWYRDVIRGE